MPPIRSLSTVKPIKSERTHEENQERAYIAASRRSDRSLEARVESARRASEIHKRRTGRSLRVTEQDVVNEEMYEEEDDDLPMQYRRLTAHLQTSNAEFDRRLAAYLTNHVAMRTALGQAVGGSSLYPNSAAFANQGAQSTFPLNPHSMGPPQSMRSPTMNRPAPYPQHSAGMKQAMHNRAASFATPKDIHNFSAINGQQSVWTPNAESRRSSMPSTPGGKRSPTSITELKFEAAKEQKAQQAKADKKSQLKLSDLPAPFDMTSNPFTSVSNAPFSTTLPVESQQLLGGALDNTDPATSMLLGPEYRSAQSFYDYGSANTTDKTNFSQASSFAGMHQTLAPGYLDTSVGDFTTDSAASDGSPYLTSAGPFSTGFDQFHGDSFQNNFGFGGNGEITPGADNAWQSLINGNAWDDLSSQPAAV